MTSKQDIVPLARFSRWKAAVYALPVFALATVPNLPGVGEHVVVTGFYYTDAGTPVRLVACGVMAMIGTVLCIAAVLANISTRAVWIDGGLLYWRSIGTRSIALGAIKSVRYAPWRGLITIVSTDRARPLEIAAAY